MIVYKFNKNSCDEGKLLGDPDEYGNLRIIGEFLVCLAEEVQDMRENTVLLITLSEKVRITAEKRRNLQRNIWKEARKRQEQMK